MVGAREEDFGEVGRFRQRNDFMYLTGVQTPAAYLIFVPAGVLSGKQQRETVFIPERNKTHEQWTGVQIGPGADGERLFGLQEVARVDCLQRAAEPVADSAVGGRQVVAKDLHRASNLEGLGA